MFRMMRVLRLCIYTHGSKTDEGKNICWYVFLLSFFCVCTQIMCLREMWLCGGGMLHRRFRIRFTFKKVIIYGYDLILHQNDSLLSSRITSNRSKINFIDHDYELKYLTTLENFQNQKSEILTNILETMANISKVVKYT